MATITQAAYAKRRGVTPSAVAYAVRDGRITLIDGRIDPDIADAEWDRNTDHSKRPYSTPESHDQPRSDPGGVSASEYMLWRARRERAEALRSEQEQEREAGQLYRKADADRAAKTMARLLRDALLALPPRLAAQLAVMTDPAKIVQHLTAEIRRALEAVEQAARSPDD